MADQGDLLRAVLAIQEQLDHRFDKVEQKLDEAVKPLDSRLTAIESDVLRFKTAGTLVAMAITVLSWDKVKPWLIALMK